MRLRQWTPPGLAALLLVLGGCAANPPQDTENLCSIFREQPDWYDYAIAAERRWSTPAHILMAFVRHESTFRHNARPPRDWFLGFIPLSRKSSAYGYAQAKNAVWSEYEDERGGLFSSRRDMKDALDFVGWYNQKSHERLGISHWDPKHLYLAYHEGHAGYRSGRWKDKSDLVRLADRVDHRAREYGWQLRQCEDEFKCDGLMEIWPFCRK